MMVDPNPIVMLVGEEVFRWLAGDFSRETLLADVPDEILARIAEVNIAARSFGGDQNAVTAIALITFAYNLAERRQQAHLGPKDILLLKVLSKAELARRLGRRVPLEIPEELPLYEIITGDVGERIRSMPTINSPFRGRC